MNRTARLVCLGALFTAASVTGCGGGAESPASGPSPAPSPGPSPSPPPSPAPGPGADLCAGLVSDKADRPMTVIAKPARLGAYLDPKFGTTVRRISDVVTQFGGSYAKPVYSTMPAWNADETYMLLYVPGQGHKLLNGKTYEVVRSLNISPADIEHVYWSATDPDALYYPSGSTLKVYRPSTNTSTTLKTFSGGIDFGPDPIYGDWNSDLFGFSGGAGNILWRNSSATQATAADVAGQNPADGQAKS